MDFDVEFAELTEAGSELEGLAERAGHLASEVQAVPLVASDFGRVPWLQTRIWEAYHHHQETCEHNLKELQATLKSNGEGLKETADNYRELEEQASDAIDHFFSKACGGGSN